MSRAQMLPTEESFEGRRARLRGAARRSIAPLTPREAEVLHGIGKGETVAVLAVRLSMSPSTAWDHVASMTAKMGLKTTHGSRCEALRTIALRAGLASVWA